MIQPEDFQLEQRATSAHERFKPSITNRVVVQVELAVAAGPINSALESKRAWSSSKMPRPRKSSLVCR